MEKPIYPLKHMRITQGYGVGTHIDSYAIDDGGKDSGIENVYAPFTGIIKKIYTNDANEVWLESTDKVEYPDGTTDYMTMMFAHSNDVSNLQVGQIINQGTAFYKEGTKGNATGNHCHFECGKGKFEGSGWHENNNGYWIINNSKKPEECLWVNDEIEIINNNNYQFKKIEKQTTLPQENKETTPTTPSNDEKQKEETNKIQKPPTNKDDNNSPKLIFTSPKDDIYAIKLLKNQQLFLK